MFASEIPRICNLVPNFDLCHKTVRDINSFLTLSSSVYRFKTLEPENTYNSRSKTDN